MKLSRLMTHTVLLAVSIVLGGVRFSSVGFSSQLKLAPIAADAAGVVGSESGSASIGMGREATIIKPLGIPTAPMLSHQVVHYTVRPGDTVARIAQQHGIPEESVRWSNLGPLSRSGSEPSLGSELLLPPIAGIAMVPQQGDTSAGLADRFHVEAVAILDFNRLRLTAEDALPAGLELVVPAGRGPDLAPAAPQSRPAAGFRSGGSTVIGFGTRVPVTAGNRFAFGNCTYYVYNRRAVPWQGDAWAWYGNAQARGFATGQSPRPGAIMVTWESGYGHVAFVESVNVDGSWIVSEMNFAAFNTVDLRLIHPGGVPLIGFIY
jgi:N-acetylmuramoyl-L-alanine amidase